MRQSVRIHSQDKGVQLQGRSALKSSSIPVLCSFILIRVEALFLRTFTEPAWQWQRIKTHQLETINPFLLAISQDCREIFSVPEVKDQGIAV